MSSLRRIFEAAVAVALAGFICVASAQVNNPGLFQSGAVVAGHCTMWGPGTGQVQDSGAACLSSAPSGANPTATAGPAAVNGVAATFMRSDGAPLVQLGSNAQKGLVQCDGSTVTCPGGTVAASSTTFGGQSVAPGASATMQGTGAKIQASTGAVTNNNCAKFDATGNVIDNGAACATQSNGANPSATASNTAVNGVATTFMRSDGAPAIQLGSNAQFGLAEGDGVSATIVAGVVSANNGMGANKLQVFTTGSGTYTTPTGAKWLKFTLVGSGGGGAGGGTAAAGDGGTGGNTCINTAGAACTTPVYQAGGGTGGLWSTSTGGTGGTVSGTGTCTISWPGENGEGTVEVAGTASVSGRPGGGAILFGGAGRGATSNVAGKNGIANTGGGAQGGGPGSGASAGFPGPGGAAGATCVALIQNPAASYTFAINAGGTAGTAGTGGQAGGVGAVGIIIAEAGFN